MKKLIKILIGLIILISFAFGQAYIQIDDNHWERVITLEDMLRYTEECYNDSTWITISAYNTLEENLGHYNIIRQDDQYIIMSIKPTFEGFSKWIESKQ